jgi:hypothetical protein
MPETIQKAAGLSVVDKLRMLLDMREQLGPEVVLREVRPPKATQ